MRSLFSAIMATTMLSAISTPASGQTAGQPMFRVPLQSASPTATMDPVYMWLQSTGACSTTCGEGTRSVSYQCQDATKPDLVFGGFGPAEADAQCVSALGAKPSNESPACAVYSGCTFDWIKPAETVNPLSGRPGCGNVRRVFTPACKRADGTTMAASDHNLCRNDLPDYNDVLNGVSGALGYDRTSIETSSCTPADYSWETGSWGAWSSTCSTAAIQTRTVTCKRGFDGAAVADSLCTAAPKPETSNVSSQLGGCSYSAVNPTAWSAYSSTCSASATRTRSFQCQRSDGTIVVNSDCTSRGIALSETETSAQYGSCTYSAVNWSGWSAWSSTCSASASRSQTAQCRRSDGTIVANSECTSRGVAVTQNETAANYSGCGYSAEFGPWGGWSSTCSASAVRTRSALCRRSDGTAVADSECTNRGISVTPTSEVSAQYGGCGYSAGNWSGWSGWSSTCSSGATRSQTASCIRSDGTVVAASECTSRGVALSQTETAAIYSGCGYSAVNWSGWSAWSSTCSASATRTASASCQRSDGAIVASSECTSRGVAVTTSETAANYSGCGYSANFGGWSAWSSTCSNNATRTRSAQCVRSDGSVVADAECTNRGIALTPTSEVSGQYGGCSYTPIYGSWSACSNSSQTRSVSCQRSDGQYVGTSACGISGDATTQSQSCVSSQPVCARGPKVTMSGQLTSGGAWQTIQTTNLATASSNGATKYVNIRGHVQFDDNGTLVPLTVTAGGQYAGSQWGTVTVRGVSYRMDVVTSVTTGSGSMTYYNYRVQLSPDLPTCP